MKIPSLGSVIVVVCLTTVCLNEQVDSVVMRTGCRQLILRNGRVRLRSRGRIAKFNCQRGYELLGDKYATCIRGRWDSPLPICVNAGCPILRNPSNSLMLESYRGAVLKFICNPGYVLNGSSVIYCDGMRWNTSTPVCQMDLTTPPATSCDFEEEDLCGWTQDLHHSFDWRRHNYATPSGHVGTGPSFDHTKGDGGDGYYMYIESSSPRVENDSARLFSPVYPGSYSSPRSCFTFWYHMYGATTGALQVYVKPENVMLSDLTPDFRQSGNQGNQWFKGVVPLSVINTSFQIILEGVRGGSYASDIAVDDVQLTNGTNCIQSSLPSDRRKVVFGGGGEVFDDSQSCRWRCISSDAAPNTTAATGATASQAEVPVLVTCDCHPGCFDNGTCCPDYSAFCIIALVTSSTTATTVLSSNTTTSKPSPTYPAPPPLPPLPPIPTLMTSPAQPAINRTKPTESLSNNSSTYKTASADSPTDSSRTSSSYQATGASVTTDISLSKELVGSTAVDIITKLKQMTDIPRNITLSGKTTPVYVQKIPDRSTTDKITTSNYMSVSKTSLNSVTIPRPAATTPKLYTTKVNSTRIFTRNTTPTPPRRGIINTTVAGTNPMAIGPVNVTAIVRKVLPTVAAYTTTTNVPSFGPVPKRPVAVPALPQALTTPKTNPTPKTIRITPPITTPTTKIPTKNAPKTTPATTPKTTPKMTPKTTLNATPKTIPKTTPTTTQTATTIAVTAVDIPSTMNNDVFAVPPAAEKPYFVQRINKYGKTKEMQQAQQSTSSRRSRKTASFPTSGIVGAVAGVIIVIAAAIAVSFLVVRRRRHFQRQDNMAEDSDVRFLTSDEIIDFNLAKPCDDKDDDDM